ncbi:quinone oxidoreductase [Klebsiella variicola subsp. variicola]|jgi:NADPH2:quinone reductase|uniref:Oxidoreductase, zinc-binding dehydrogenase family n=1 Tax=Klebsiella variicola (strain 342) TaxID=507522 RepID=B5XPM0_KLEV3|nr:quinone oxidoreductase [Klebsiella variicola]ACI08473.1 oxidoreductase, zinc-binding dehydrogenase family [Klebsiella variicola]EGT0638373.1 quinone oxidoreductase [Citrobacter werkmanii]
MPAAIIITQPGGPEVLRTTDIAIKAPGPDEVQIRHEVIGVNFVDIYYRSGLYPQSSSPAIPGFEGGGIVTATGINVRAFAQGDRVAYTGNPMGAYAEIRNIPASRLVRIPMNIDIRTAGSSMLRGLTAHMLLHKVRNVREGDWILVHSAAGGLGQLVTRWATMKGARVIGTTGSAAKVKIAQAAGAKEVLLHTDAAWADKAREISDGRGVHLAVDGIGGTMLSTTLSVVRPFGTVASLGQPAGPIPPVRVEELGFTRSIALMRPSSMAYADDAELYAQGARALISALQNGLINPVGAEYPLTHAAEAHADLEAGRTTGSVILTV